MEKYGLFAIWLLFATSATAGVAFQGLSGNSCADLFGVKNNSMLISKTRLTDWVFGFFSGLNAAFIGRDGFYADLSSIQNENQVIDLIKNECEGAPQLLIFDASSAVYRKFGEQNLIQIEN